MILAGLPTIPIPNAQPLSDAGRMFMLTWLEVDVLLGRPVTAELWRDAYGRAADYQTVHNARLALAAMPVAAGAA